MKGVISMAKNVIKECMIKKDEYENFVFVKTNETGDEGTLLFPYYPDEISFTTDELIGLTIDEAFELKKQKDLRYLQS